jgi:ABC-type amino acid transport substrate-binding protein
MKKIVLMLSLSIIFLFNGSVLAKNYEVIRFGVDPNYAPFAYKDNTGQLVGLKLISATLSVHTWMSVASGSRLTTTL